MEQQSNAPEHRSTTHRKIRLVLYTMLFLAALVLLIFLYWYFFHRNMVSSNDARIEADTVDLSPQITGKLAALNVAGGDTVTSGQVLFELDNTMLLANLNKAQNDLAAAEKSLAVAEEQYRKAVNGPRAEEIAVARTNVGSASEKRDLAEKEWKRVDQLYRANSVPQADWEHAQSAYALALNDFQNAEENLKLLEAGTRPEDKEIAARNVELIRAQITSVASTVKQAEVNLEYATVTAPFDGIVVRVWREPGSVVTQGTPVLTAFDLGSLYVSANIEETNLHRVIPGDQAVITIDAFPGVHVNGYIDQILQAANSEFGLIPSAGVSGTFIKVTQRIQLLIRFQNYADIRPLRLGPGLSVEVRVNTIHAAGENPEQ